MFRLLAFVGRYAHQDMSSMLRMTLSDLQGLAQATAKLLEEENSSMERD